MKPNPLAVESALCDKDPMVKINKLEFKHEVLQILQEECAEVIQAASKCVRFGTEENLLHLEKELGDVLCILDILHQHDMVSLTNLDQFVAEKYEKLEKYSNLLK